MKKFILILVFLLSSYCVAQETSPVYIGLSSSVTAAELQGIPGTVSDALTVTGVLNPDRRLHIFRVEITGPYKLFTNTGAGLTEDTTWAGSGTDGLIVFGGDGENGLRTQTAADTNELKVATGTTIQLLQLSGTNELGGGTFAKKPESTNPVDHVKIYSHPESGSVWKRDGSAEIINVIWAGALGDGVADDGDAILRAAAAMPADGRATLYYPAGEYDIGSATVNAGTNWTIRGDGFGTLLFTDDPEINIFNITDVDSVTVSSMKIRHAGVTSIAFSAIFLIKRGDHIKLSSMILEDAPDVNIDVEKVKFLTIENVFTSGAFSLHGIGLVDVEFSNITETTSFSNNESGLFIFRGHDILIEGLTSDLNLSGCKIDGDSTIAITFSGCTFANNDRGIDLNDECRGILFTNVTVQNNSVFGVLVGAGNHKDIIFNSCKFVASGSSFTAFRALAPAAPVGDLFASLSITGCQFNNNERGGLETAGDWQFLSITNNTFTNNGGVFDYDGSFGIITGNSFVNNAFATGTSINIIVRDGSDHNFIANNLIVCKRGTGLTQIGIDIGGACDSNIVMNNSVLFHSVRAIRDFGRSTSLVNNYPAATSALIGAGQNPYDFGSGAMYGLIKQVQIDTLLVGVTNAQPKIISGSGSPEGVEVARIGSIFLRIDGGAATTMYIKESGTGNTGWIAK